MRRDRLSRAMVRHAPSLLALGLGILAVLGSSHSTPEPRERFGEEPPREERRPPPARRAAALPYPPCPGPPGEVSRAQLDAILRRGPGVFLSGIDVTMVPRAALPESARRAWPSLVGTGSAREFGGWRLNRFHPGDPCLGRAGFGPGDIVVSVNDRTLQRPEDLGALWASLDRAPHLVTRLVRGGEPLTFVVRIVGAPAPNRPEPERGGGESRP